MRRLVRSTAILGLGSAAGLVAAILRSKILASRLGPEGTGVLAQLATLTAVLVPLATLSMGNGAIKMIAEARAQGDLGRVRRVTRTVLALSAVVSLGLCVLTAALSLWIAGGLFHDSKLWWAVVITSLTVPITAIASLRISMLQGHEDVRSMAGIQTAVAVVNMATIAPMAWLYGVPGAVAQLLVLAITYDVLSRRSLRPHTPTREAVAAVGGAGTGRSAGAGGTMAPRGTAPESSVDRSLIRPLARYGGSALLVGLSATLTLLILRGILVGKLGLAQNGIYQVCIGVSGMVMPLILNAIAATVWPEIAGFPRDHDAGVPMRSALRLGVLLVTAVGAALQVGAPIWVPLLYSQKFLPALDLLPFQFLGDYFRAVAWIFSIWLVPRERLKPWVLYDVVYAIVLLVVFLFLVDRIGVKSVVIAYVAAHVSHAVLHYALARRVIGFRVGPDNRVLLGASFLLLVGLTALRPRDLTGVGIGAAATVAWALIVVKQREWIALRDIGFRFLGRLKGGAGAQGPP
jgi:O-antigen/teichoic acid export membrane protein